MNKKTPASLKVVIQFIILIFLVMNIISAINLYLCVTRTTNLTIEIGVEKNGYDRIHFTAKSRIILRSMINMANGYEPMYSEILP